MSQLGPGLLLGQPVTQGLGAGDDDGVGAALEELVKWRVPERQFLGRATGTLDSRAVMADLDGRTTGSGIEEAGEEPFRLTDRALGHVVHQRHFDGGAARAGPFGCRVRVGDDGQGGHSVDLRRIGDVDGIAQQLLDFDDTGMIRCAAHDGQDEGATAVSSVHM